MYSRCTTKPEASCCEPGLALSIELPNKKSSTIFNHIMVFSQSCLLVNDHPDGRELHEERANSRNNRLVRLVAKQFSIGSAEKSRFQNIWKDFGASTSPAVLRNDSHTQEIFYVYVEKPVEPHMLSRESKQSWKEPYNSQL